MSYSRIFFYTGVAFLGHLQLLLTIVISAPTHFQKKEKTLNLIKISQYIHIQEICLYMHLYKACVPLKFTLALSIDDDLLYKYTCEHTGGKYDIDRYIGQLPMYSYKDYRRSF